MDPLKPSTEHHIHIQDVKHQEKKLTRGQQIILFQVHLANVLLFGAGTLNPEQSKLQEELEQQYLQGLKAGDEVEIGLQGMMPSYPGTVVSNDGQIIKIKASCYLNKKRKEGIRSFSTKDGHSRGFIIMQDTRFDETKLQRFYIVTPESHTVKSTAGIPPKAMEEINELYKQAGDPTTCYDLVNNLKYGNNPPPRISGKTDTPAPDNDELEF